ncbi:uncharacterized protein LOC118647829 isoform X1 [Monomorium pharaonis]|uniref:uncharacterized protein LOC118647829 isoform X1 n=1 Tax=Monomorium pharaonis TaxID=307658 RepID=UPI0017472287|nr:uncharacterized protein LOC118647829 isoform X1 [Monomorium pharaonis]
MSKRKVPYTQKYRKEWESDPLLKDWIQETPTDKSTVSCKYCGCILKAHHALLVEHTKTSKHIKAAEPFSSHRQSKLKFDQASTYSLETATFELKMVLFVTCHCAIRCIDHLSALTKPISKTINNEIKLHRSKATGVLKNIIALHFKSDLRLDIGDSFYSLLIDESTDIAVLKQLGICIIYFSVKRKNVISTFLKLESLEGGDARSIVKAIKVALTEYGLSVQKMRGLGTDNASVMIGVNNGVFRQLKEEIPHLLLIRCVCHSIQLAISNAVADTLPRNLEFLISETYNWFSRSTERREQYKILFKALNDGLEPLKILQVAATRWLSITNAVRRVLQQWLELKTHFYLRRTADKCYAAELLYNMYTDIRNKLYFIFLEPILNETESVNKAFQTNNGDPVKLLNDLTVLIKGLAQRIVITGCKEDLLKINVKDYLHPHPYLGYKFEEKMKEARTNNLLTIDDEILIRTRCIDFVVALVSQLQQRLPDNIDILLNISLLSPENSLRAIKPSVIPLAKLMNETKDDITKIDYQ